MYNNLDTKIAANASAITTSDTTLNPLATDNYDALEDLTATRIAQMNDNNDLMNGLLTDDSDSSSIAQYFDDLDTAIDSLNTNIDTLAESNKNLTTDLDSTLKALIELTLDGDADSSSDGIKEIDTTLNAMVTDNLASLTSVKTHLVDKVDDVNWTALDST